MNIREAIVERGLNYLDHNTKGEGIVIPVVAAVITDDEIARHHKAAYIARHKARVGSGDIAQLDPASACLHLAAGVSKGIGVQEKTWHRRRELVHGVVLNRRRIVAESPQGA